MQFDSREILLKLVRLAMGWESDYSLPENIDWHEVSRMASEQGVLAIMMDGYQVLLDNNKSIYPFTKIPENKSLRVKLLSEFRSIEMAYNTKIASLSVLSNILSDAGIPFLVLKGFSCARYYPFPNHRGCGDIDIYPGSYFADSNKALIRAGFDVDPHYYRHSVSTVNDVLVENHRVLCDLRGPRQTRSLEVLMEKYANESISFGDAVKVDGELVRGAFYPSPDFNALFLPWHVSAHFEFERVTLRHLLDWALFLLNEGNRIDIDMFREAKKKYTFGYSKFADILTSLAINYLHIPVVGISDAILSDSQAVDFSLVGKVWNYMFDGQPRERDSNVWKFRMNNVGRIWKERWKYRELYGMNALSVLFYKVFGVLFKVGEDDQ